jgi:hypothetical protein
MTFTGPKRPIGNEIHILSIQGSTSIQHGNCSQPRTPQCNTTSTSSANRTTGDNKAACPQCDCLASGCCSKTIGQHRPTLHTAPQSTHTGCYYPPCLPRVLDAQAPGQWCLIGHILTQPLHIQLQLSNEYNKRASRMTGSKPPATRSTKTTPIHHRQNVPPSNARLHTSCRQ